MKAMRKAVVMLGVAAACAFGGSPRAEAAPSQPWTAKKAKVLDGAVYDAAGKVAGVVQLKVAKPNGKKHDAKVSGAVTLLDGRKRMLKAVALGVPADKPLSGSVNVKGLGALSLAVGDDGFEGSVGGYSLSAAKVGGKWTRTDARVYAEAGTALPHGTVERLLPSGVPVRAKGGKWAFDRAASITYKKGALGGDADPKKPNLSAMKLTYTPKTGLFKGSFKVYAVQGGKLKKYTVKVTGAVVDGAGTGVGKLAKPAAAWRVTVGDAPGAGKDDPGGAPEAGSDDSREKVRLWAGGPLWATTNVGARYPWHTGYYFWWGDTEGHRPVSGGTFDFDFSATNPAIYTYGKSVSELQSDGWLTTDNVLTPEHDAAHVQWGGDWRMPTKQEMDDLVDKCDWTPATTNGMAGFIVRGTGDYAANSIFLPCAGYGDGTSLDYSGSTGNYWSSAPYSDGSSTFELYFGSGYHGTDGSGRYFGQSVRPVQGGTE